MIHKKALIISLSIIVVITFLSGCVNNEKSTGNNFHLSLSGESENWKVSSYNILIKPDALKAGNGNLTMKNKAEFNTDFLSIRVHAVIDNEDRIIQGKSIQGSESNITQTSTGVTEGGTFIDEEGEPISLENISDIYMTIEWHDIKGANKEEIDLFDPEVAS
ncbi:hypothetical protein CEH05_07470 [Halobacillus halophilus]|uniref:Lipoprotein n=1 Tax=Halobacillus halophilus (strain ATCC 35676 / DSM 2266 / JCM 20832 / KCTC 3685 / LMG 17431 / NBRC 102448 / NCIMB 2269) TaxID=866895 RepID=I0JL16_HALH3|nr:hypothetical protein [Halobacillus halophilus]ASF38958.1 hypothetical protein CEH05_07470 [Halobacillus halophilus]CCG44836.1 hypothetical protein HBHAL_2492 [Halobacillus halophilus DSM 2266]